MEPLEFIMVKKDYGGKKAKIKLLL